MASKHPLRRSCAFCRARKIKCSNETICEACRRQGADCIYDFEPPRPKARTISHDGSRTEASGTPGANRPRSSTCGSPRGSPVGDDCTGAEDADSVARVLQRSFLDNFGDGGPRRRETMSTARPGPIKYTGILALLARDLVGLASDQLGILGCHHVKEGGGRFFRTELSGDDTPAMFDDNGSGSGSGSGNPLSDYGQRQQTQLVDVWFSMHPLSFVVSKTLLLHELRDGTHDEILLAAMLADANFSLGDDVAVARGHVLLRWATAQLGRRRFRLGAGAGFGGAAPHGVAGASTRVFGGISTAQTLMLLGWHALCSQQMRRAACYIGLAARIAGDIRDQMAGAAAAAAPPTSSRINGIDVFDVEKEVVAYLYWTTFSLGLWASIQTGHRLVVAAAATSSSTPAALTPVFLPVTEASSVMIKLDLVSENISTLQKQKAVLREMWPLAHMASIVAYITAGHPHDADVAYRDLHRVLAEGIHALNRQAVDVSSRSLVLLAYHTMAVHFLFPATQQQSLSFAGHGDDCGVSADVLERFCASAHDLVRIFDAVVAEQPQDLLGVTPSLRSSLPDVFCLALDACARALKLIDARRITGALLLLGDGPLVAQQAWDGRLLALARSLLDVTADDFLNQGRSLRMVRKSLKSFVRGLGGPGSASSGSGSSGFPSPANNARGSLPHTPMHSPASAVAAPATVGSDSDRLSSFVLSPLNAPATAATTPSLHSSSDASVFGPDELCKPDWHAATDYLPISDLDPAWLPQMPGVMDLDMDMDLTPPMAAGLHWDWPAVTGIDATTTIPPAASDMDSVLYYFENGHNKRPC
ncbi:hypothetical protein XA68_18533 [Ophiocordyceps unilateralis]|uniref:Zn(2)-C6 fungal-type domain-containing protein n=1 Tax=Ophiocordyceps unilateralis TaxID=268505 RepID=A0A2A9P1P8_OPHUN|nr:hypothetical protein XA68_18533 [Ophiocordyceps unilateralis]